MKIPENMYQDFFENSPDLLAIGDHITRKFFDCNNTFLNMLGYTKEEVLSMNSYFDLYHEEDFEIINQATIIYEAQGYLNNYEVVLKKTDGSKFYGALSLNCIRDDKGAISYTRAVWRDINDLVNTRRDLIQANHDLQKQKCEMENLHRFYEDFLENAPDMFMTAMIDRPDKVKYLYCNNTLARELGYTKQEIYDLGSKDLYAPECINDVINQRRILITELKIQHKHTLLKKKNGENVITSCNAVAEELGDGKFLVRAVWRNVSDLINAQNKLHELNQALKRQNEENKTFIHLLSHDMQSPIRGIDNLAQWIIEECEHLLPLSSRTNLHKLKGRVKRLEHLVSDILLYLQQESACIEETYLGEIIDNVILKFCQSASEKITLHENLNNFKTDKTLLSQVFYNLISNAFKHHLQPDVARVRIYGGEEEGKLIFKVADNGPGIAEQFHDLIFEPLKQLKPKNQVEGSGMGLAIVRKIIVAQGGFIKVESEEGKGATFIFSWPKMSH